MSIKSAYRVLFLVSSLKKSGPTNQLSYIIKYLDKSVFNPMILTLSNEIDDSAISYFVDKLGVRVDTLGLSRLNGIIKAKSKVKKYISDNGKIMSSKITSVSFSKQKKLTREIKKAKILGLI